MHRIAAYKQSQLSNAVLLRLRQLALLTLQELQILQGLPQTARHHPAQTELCLAGRVQSPLMLLSGWVCCQRIIGDGRRQIVRFILPGDAVGSIAHSSKPAPTAAVALTPVVVTDARVLLRATNEVGGCLPGFAGALAALACADENGMNNQVVRLGRQTAYERIVHLMMEFHDRLRTVELVDGNTFSMPLTQEVLGDALGLSVVHFNRTLQQIRRDKLLDIRSGVVTLHQPELMRTVADWPIQWPR